LKAAKRLRSLAAQIGFKPRDCRFRLRLTRKKPESTERCTPPPTIDVTAPPIADRRQVTSAASSKVLKAATKPNKTTARS